MKKIILGILSLTILGACSIDTSLDVENFNDADYNTVLSNAEDLEKILGSSAIDVLGISHSSGSLHYMLMADQITSTNKSRDFWGFAQQPRKQFDNGVNYDGYRANLWPWNSAYSAIRGANHIIRWIDGEGKDFIVNDVDKTEEAIATAYLIKGIAEGYLAMIFDKGYIVNWNSTTEELTKQHDYNALMVKSLEDIDKAIELANNSNATFSSTYFVDYPLNKQVFVEFANSMAARCLIGLPRTKAEAKNTDFDKVLSYANKGMSTDLKIPTKVDVWYSFLIDWGTYYVASAGYLPVDQKVMHLMDEANQPKDYPTASDVILPEVVTTDSRLDYFAYRGGNFGYLRPDRDRALFSSYFSLRWYNNNDLNVAGYQNPIFMKSEIDYIKAEAQLKKGSASDAVASLDMSPRKTVGNLSTTADYASVMKALHYEYSVELHFSGGAQSQWSFMRRNDLLQEGSFTMLPIPGSELEAQGISDSYTFGGNVGQAGTASTKGWKDSNSYNE